MNQLFDPDQFPSPADKEARTRRTPTPAEAATVEPWVEPWVVVSTRKGPLPYTHLPIDPADLAKARREGFLDRTSLRTVCGLVGWPISRAAAGVGQMLACPECKAGS